MKKKFENWEPTHEQNIGIVSSVYEFIKEELSELQEITECPILLFMISLQESNMSGIQNHVTH